MKLLKENKYIDLLILAVIIIILYKVVDNYQYLFNVLNKLYSIVSPFICALICAYILSPLVNLFEKRLKMNDVAAIFSTYAFITGIIIIILFFTIPSFINSILSITDNIPQYIEKARKYVNYISVNRHFEIFLSRTEIYKKIDAIATTAGNYVVIFLQNSVASLLSLTGSVVKFLIGFLMSIYVLLDRKKLLGEAKTLIYMIFKEKNGTIIINVIKTYNIMIGRYIGIKAIDSIIIGFIAFIGLYIVNAPYYVFIACVVAVTNMIPYFGPLIGEIFGALITFFVSPIRAIIVFLLLLLIQQFDAWYLDPKLIGRKVGVSPFGIIFAVIIGGGLFGPVGMLLASPTMATINIYYSRMISNYRNKNANLLKNK